MRERERERERERGGEGEVNTGPQLDPARAVTELPKYWGGRGRPGPWPQAQRKTETNTRGADSEIYPETIEWPNAGRDPWSSFSFFSLSLSSPLLFQSIHIYSTARRAGYAVDRIPVVVLSVASSWK